MWWALIAGCGHRPPTLPAPYTVIPTYRIDWGTSEDGQELQLQVEILIPSEDRPVEVTLDYSLISQGVGNEAFTWTEGPYPMNPDGTYPTLFLRPPVPLEGTPVHLTAYVRSWNADGSAGPGMSAPEAYLWSGADGKPRVAPTWWVAERLQPNERPLWVDLSEAIVEDYLPILDAR